MGADLSRIRSNPLLDFASVELKQGGVMLDADFNEFVAVVDRRLRAAASDILGRSTVSSTTPDAFKITAVAGALSIGKGRLYVDGLLAENHGAVSTDPAKKLFDPLMAEANFADPIAYIAQPYLPNPPTLPTVGRHLVYLDVWQREVTHLERPDLVETAVGVETSSRLQTVWQVRVLGDDAGNATCTSPDGDVAGWTGLIAPSTGRLSTGTFDVPPSTDPCELPPTGGYRGLENQTYRVEIQDPGQPGGTATFKWSRENASVGSRVASMVSATELELHTLGRDDVLRFNTGDWVEITDDVRELSQRCGEMRHITVNEAASRITFTLALPTEMIPGAFPNSSFPHDRNLRVRRWDQKGKVLRTGPGGTTPQFQDLDVVGSTGVINVPAAGTTLLLENGVTVSFASVGTTGFRAGDYWVFAARTADASVELLANAPPRGIHHHYARLGIWDVGAGAVTDCRTPWPPRGEGHDCGCTECVTPQSHASGALTIQAAVDRIRETGGTVCLSVGQYQLTEPVRLIGARSVRIKGQGAATVIVTPGGAFSVQTGIALAIEDLAIVSLGRQSAISVQTVAGLALQKLVIAMFGGNDARGAAIALTGVVAGLSIKDNLIVAPDAIKAGDPTAAGGRPGADRAPQFLVTAALSIEGNILWCQREAVALAGTVAHLYGSRIRGNEILGCRDGGISVLGFALPGASMRICGNSLNVNGPGIRCSVDGAWIEGNKVNAVRQGQQRPTGSGIALVTGLDLNGSDQCQVLANQVSGFPDAGILIQVPVEELIVKLNIIEGCGNGILMMQDAKSGAVSIENNHLRNIGSDQAEPRLGRFSVGIGLSRTDSANVVGNSIRQVGVNATAGQQVLAGVLCFGVLRSRIHGNEVSEIGPLADFGGTVGGILLRAPYAQLEIAHNHVERDAQPGFAISKTPWQALSVEEPGVEAGRTVVRTGNHTAVRVDDTRTLVIANDRAYVSAAAVAVDAAGAQAVLGASATVLGNTLIARGRDPAVEVVVSGDLMFSNNRCELRANASADAVRLAANTAIVNANRVRGGDVSMRLSVNAQRVTVMGNITTNPIAATGLPAVWGPLNIQA